MAQLESLYTVVFNENLPGERQFKLDDLIEKRAQLQHITVEESKATLLRKMPQVQSFRQQKGRGPGKARTMQNRCE